MADCKAYDGLIDLPERAPDALPVERASDADMISDNLAERKSRLSFPVGETAL